MLRSTLALWILSATLAAGQNHFYDATIGNQLANVPGASPVTMTYHAYPWIPLDKKYLPSIEKAAKTLSKQLCFDYEPWALPKDHDQAIFRRNAVAIDPRHESLEVIQRQHQQYAEALVAVAPLAKRLQVSPGIYGFLSLHHRRLGDVYSDGSRLDRWKQDQRRVLELPVTFDGEETTLIKVLNDSGGAVWIPWYVPNQWNERRFAGKSAKVFPRLCAAIEAAGGKAIPILNPQTVGGERGNPTTVLPEIQRQLIRLAREGHGNEWAVWAKPDEMTDEFRNLLREELSR